MMLNPIGALGDNQFNKSEQMIIESIEDWFNNLKTMQSDFAQLDHDGTYRYGKIFIKRPGYMRLDYDDPNPILLIANGTFLVFIDQQRKQITNYPLSSTPVWFLLREHVSFTNDDYIIRSIKKQFGLIYITFFKRNEEASGWVELIFNDNPIE
ncbi:MAG: outer-membrane lipoprotein carrier protein LolA, partial [Pseudomonadota bacterium]